MSFCPSVLLISIDGILIPAPVPSSDITTSSIGSSDESMTIAIAAPASSIFLTLVTNEQPPLSARINGGKPLSNVFYKVSVLLIVPGIPKGFIALKLNSSSGTLVQRV